MKIPESFSETWSADEEAQEYELTLTDREREWLAKRLAVRGLTMLSEVELCESPIERLMGMALVDKLFNSDLLGDSAFVLNPQHEITVGGHTFRADFMIGVLVDGVDCSVVVECDGHDFHEKTKAQARRDKKRDRLLQMAGYPVLRFTGSEIWESPEQCARQVVQFINEQWARRR